MRLCLVYMCMLACGCSSSAKQGLAVLVQDKHTLNTSQPCSYSRDFLAAADLATVVVARRWREDNVFICQVHQPEPCRFGGWTRGPCNLELERCARKRGCASPYTLWVSRRWPPVCAPDWPDEPHCVRSEDEQSESWESDLLHELVNVVAQRCGVHDATKQHQIYAADGLNARAWAAYQAARGSAQ